MLISSVMSNPRTSQLISVSEISPFFYLQFNLCGSPMKKIFSSEMNHIIILQMLTSDSLWIAGFIGYQVTGKSAYSDI